MPRWLVYSLLAPACWGVWGVVSKTIGGLSAAQQQALSTLGIVPIMLVLCLGPGWREGRRKLRGASLAFLSGVLVALGNMAYYHALAVGSSAAAAVALTAMYPLATIVLAVPLLKEKPSRIQLAGIGVALAASWLLNVEQPHGLLSASTLLALAPIALWGSAALVQKLAMNEVSAELGTFWFLAAFIPLGIVLLAIEGLPPSVTPRDWLLVVILGATYGLGNLALLAAFRHGGKASIVTPVTGLYPVVAIPLAVVLFQEQVGARQWTGIALALAAVVALSFERRQPC